MSKESLSPELIAAVRDIIENIAMETVGYEFDEILDFFQEEMSNDSITEADFILDLLESAGYQDEGDAALEDLVVFGLIAMAGQMSLL